MGKECVALEDHANLLLGYGINLRLILLFGDVSLSINGYCAIIDLLQPHNATQQRALTASAGAKHNESI
ncbi:hypothetical protein D9M68_879040 [compost metagenome]